MAALAYPSRSIILTRDRAKILFDRVRTEHGRLDILACAVWGGNERFVDPIWKQPFWNLPLEFWDDFMGAGPQAFWIAACEAARLMSQQHSGLIAAISEPMIEPDKLSGNPQWDLFEHLPHYALNRLVVSLASDARKAGFTVLGLLPGFMKTERVQVHMQDEALQKLYRYDLAESPEYTGRAVVALASDPECDRKVRATDLRRRCGKGIRFHRYRRPLHPEFLSGHRTAVIRSPSALPPSTILVVLASKMIRVNYFLFRLTPPRPTFSQDMTSAEREVMQTHGAYWSSLADRGSQSLSAQLQIRPARGALQSSNQPIRPRRAPWRMQTP